MKFRIGPWMYRLRITEGPLVHEGVPCLSACLQSPREILIAGDCPVADRGRAMYTELTRAWTFEKGIPASADGWLALAASMAMQATIDLNQQGGILALRSLRPAESADGAAARLGLSRERVCGTCGGSVAGGSVGCSPAADKPGIVDLELYCEFCGQTQFWQEAQTIAGMPSGIVVGEAYFRAGDSRRLLVPTG